MDGDERAGGPARDDPVRAEDVPRLAAWLRSARVTTDAELAALFRGVPPERVRHVERVLDDLARGCGPPSPADLATLTELDDRLARGGS